jgi:hypothetical protein
MTTNEWLTLAAIIIGPISAVGITLWIDKTRRVRERQLYIMRMLLTTRHMPADAQYNAAINLIPAEFNDQDEVMALWRKYCVVVRERPDEQSRADHKRRTEVAQSAMIFQVMKSLGLKNLSEGDIQTEAYVSQGFIDRDNFYINSLRAMPEIAATLKRQSELTQTIVDNIPRRPAEPDNLPVRR